MNRKEFDSSFNVMCRALGVKVNKWQGELFWDEFKNKNAKDFNAACVYCGRGTPGKLPFQTTFGDAISAANEMRLQKEKDDQEKKPMSGRINFTPEERLKANRAANEVARQAREGRKTGRNCFNVEKVKAAQEDTSKDDEIMAKYGDETPNPAIIFGNLVGG